MYINSVGHYLPSTVISNEYFKDLNGLTDEWIFTRTGIKNRRRATGDENTNTMAIEAVKNAADSLSYPITEANLIVGATYSPFDTVGTLAHAVQRFFEIEKTAAISISSACSSFINGLEIVQGYFAINKANKAIVVASEHNSSYSHDNDEKSGHLWGDGSASMVISKERISENDPEIVDVMTHGLGHLGKGTEGVCLFPNKGGLVMPFGKDVFVHACNQMGSIVTHLLHRNGYDISDLSYVIPHQANVRIMNHVAQELKLQPEQCISNIEDCGNTGCASAFIALAQNRNRFKKGDIVVVTVFGGGYSSGGVLIRF